MIRNLSKALALLGGLVLISTSLRAEIVTCADPALLVDSEGEDMAGRVCAAAIAAKALLSECGLVQTAPIVTRVVDSAEHPTFGACAALFDLESGCIEVTGPDRLPALLPEGDARAELPPEVLFAAAITHEFAHVLVQQTAGEVNIGAAEQEFVANAFEMASLEPQWREMILSADPVDPHGAISLVHLSIYALAPRVFANNAWMLFDRPEFGCALVQKIVAGEYRFPRR